MSGESGAKNRGEDSFFLLGFGRARGDRPQKSTQTVGVHIFWPGDFGVDFREAAVRGAIGGRWIEVRGAKPDKGNGIFAA